MTILAIILLAGTAVGVAAQDGTAEGSAPSTFTWDAGPPEFSEDPATGLPAVVVQIEATDPRAAGTATNIEDGARIEDGEWKYYTLVSAVRLVNDGGSWVGTGRGVNAVGVADEDAGSRAWLTEYSGEGGYEGLTMYTFRLGLGAEPPQSIGFIVPADAVPPFPAPPAR